MKDNSQNDSDRLNIESKPLRKNFYKVITLMIIIGIIALIVIVSKLVTNNNKDNLEKNNKENNIEQANEEQYIGNIYTDISEKVSKHLVTISPNECLSDNAQNITGIVISDDGYIITNYSPLKNFEDIYVSIYGDEAKTLKANIVVFDENLDTVLLKVKEKTLEPIEYIEREIINGENILIVGKNNAQDDTSMISNGIVTSKFKINNSISLIRTNAIINNDNTGGIVCDLDGRLVGIASKTLSEKYNENGLYCCVGIKNILEMINKDSYIGIQGRAVSESGENSFQGVYIESVEKNSIAEKSGLHATDIIISIENNPVSTMYDVYTVFKENESKNIIECVIYRQLQEKTIQLNMNEN